MGRSTDAEQVPFQATVWDGDVYWRKRDKAPAFFIKQQNHEERATSGRPKPLIINGWTGTWGETYGSLYVEKWVKGDWIVYFINENEYENGGGMTATYFADNEAALRAFLDENFPGAIKFGITANKTVHQTL